MVFKMDFLEEKKSADNKKACKITEHAKCKITHDSPVLYDLGDVISETVAFMEDSLMVLGSLLSNR